ncbi:DUF2505 domain-containing protein [Microlunatus sp. Y2014]|uniref:DUF2505 domain-containing protein n=1 Tax=Microlunatus sp. Y2014 TaxID=3418488 RepID=UPI003DA72539
MDISSRAEFAADPARVFEMLTTKEFLDEVCVAGHAREYECSVSGSTTTSRRVLPAPDSASKFTGPTLTVVEEITWGDARPDGGRTGQVKLTVPGQPVNLSGTVELAPGGPGSTIDLKADLKVNIPLLGKKLEQSAAPAILAGFDVQQQVGQRWLAGGSA